MNGKCYQNLLNVVYASCYPAGSASGDSLAGDDGDGGDDDGVLDDGKLFYVLIIIIIIIIILYNAYTHSVHSALHVTSLKTHLLPLPCQVGYFMC